jgi:PAS domain S-box-containing protein
MKNNPNNRSHREQSADNEALLPSVKELHQSRRKYEQLFNSLNDAASVFEMLDNGLPGKYLEVNDTLCAWLGFTREELLTKTPLDISEKIDPAVNTELAQTFAKGNQAVIERTLISKNGTRIPVEVSFHFINYEGRKAGLSISRNIAERKMAEASLRDSEEKFRTFVEQNLEGVTLVNEDGVVIEWNAAMERLSGIPRLEAIGEPLWDVHFGMMAPERQSRERYKRQQETIREALATGVLASPEEPFEFEIVRADGTRLFVQQTVFPIKTLRGFRFGSITRDVTHQKKWEQALRESEEKFRKTFYLSPDAINVNRVSDGRYVSVNKGFCRITGYREDEIVGKSSVEKSIWDDPGDRAALVKGLQAHGIVESYRAWFRMKDGTRRFGSVSATLFELGGEPHILSITRDLTKEKHAEDRLKQREELYRALVETTGTGYVVIDGSGIVLDANAEYVRLTGRTSLSEIRGHSVLDWTAEPDRQRNAEAVAACVRDGQVRDFRTNYAAPGGEIAPVELSATVVGTGSSSKILTLCRDISEKKKMEESLSKAEKLESLGILAGGIAHDFNNLLTGIFGYIDIARLYNSSGSADKVSMNLSKALDVFNRARALTQQLLTFSKGGRPVKKIMGLSTLLTNSANFVLSGSSVSPRFLFPEDLWACEVDENQMGQVIDNIVINARQAMPTGGTVIVTAENVPAEEPVPQPLLAGDYVKISIRDFGIGIAKEHLPYIFDPFFTTKQEGSGLGLATAYSIVRRHEGLVEVESDLGTGTTFRIYLPALPSAPAGTPSAGTKRHRGYGTVLVMDDEDFVRDVAGQLLHSMGYTVDFAASGSEAIEKYRKVLGSPVPYAFVILDLTIPGGLGGKQVVQELLKLDPPRGRHRDKRVFRRSGDDQPI